MEDARKQGIVSLAQGQSPLCGYGTPEQFFVGCGAARSLVIDEPEADTWGRINAFFREARGQFVFGYIGFDVHSARIPLLKRAVYPSVHLFIPRETHTFLGVGGREEVVKDVFFPSECSDDRDSAHLLLVQRALDWVRQQPEQRRLTVSRRVPITRPVQLLPALSCSALSSALTRSFYFLNGSFECIGHSPELLAEGSLEAFKTYKLSATIGRSPDPREDAFLKEVLLSGKKLREEHASSAAQYADHLNALGRVVQTEPRVLDLPRLRHLLTEFHVRPRSSVGVADCLEAVFPSGAAPYEDGLRELARVEQEGRGAYYGLIGMLTPEGTFSFSQILRTAFRDQTGAYYRVGAAVTADSHPEDELEEMQWKLLDCPVLPLKKI